MGDLFSLSKNHFILTDVYFIHSNMIVFPLHATMNIPISETNELIIVDTEYGDILFQFPILLSRDE